MVFYYLTTPIILQKYEQWRPFSQCHRAMALVEPSEMLQNLPYFCNIKTYIVVFFHFSWSALLFFPSLTNEGPNANIELDIH